MADAYLANNPAVVAYSAAATYIVKFSASNSGPATLAFNALAPAPIVTAAGAALTGGEIGTGATMQLTYDGANFVLGASVPVLAPGSVAGSAIQGAGNVNLIPDSEFRLGSTYWTVAAPLAIQTGGGVGGGNALAAAGTGAALANVEAYCSAIAVRPGTYILSAWIDARNVTSVTQPAWLLMSPDRSTTYGSVVAAAGAYERVQSSIAVPSGVTQAIAVFSTEGCTVASGASLVTSAPQLELAPAATSSAPSQATSYRPGPGGEVAGVNASNQVTTQSVAPAAINNIAIAENTSSQPIAVTAVTGTTPPSAPSSWTQVASVALDVASASDWIRLQALVEIEVTNFFIQATKYAFSGGGSATIVFDQIWARVRETTTNTVVWQTTCGSYIGAQALGATPGYSTTSQNAFAMFGPMAGVPGSKLVSGLSGSLNFALEIGATDMASQYAAAAALSATVTDAYLEAWDVQR